MLLCDSQEWSHFARHVNCVYYCSGASFTKEAKYAATTPEEQRSAVIEREAEAVLRTWTEDDDAGGCKDAEMGSLTGWQALADQVGAFLHMAALHSLHVCVLEQCASAAPYQQPQERIYTSWSLGACGLSTLSKALQHQ